MKPTDTGYHIRSKNAGPFWLTIDIFCDDAGVYRRMCDEPLLGPEAIGRLLRTSPEGIKTFHVDALNVIKISLPRPVVQGALEDRDMHGAQWANLVRESLASAHAS
ncbi:DUF4387 domain-containing protein [Verticiella sediminum]|uniref:DUF4387 domain-containing protein n=1 Tax=Verticiella sediminum TaxID=1247510 RepID=A0A556ANL2_9BURK|nr:DUF4387 domain-containing protein [Verticiella sediminum]TSH94468.1 DUF4387 domain-containing protein [Verticiella sediminum]